MKRYLLLVPLVVLVFGVVPAAAQKKPSFLVVGPPMADARAGQAFRATEVGAWVRELENFVEEALLDKYSCGKTLDDSDVEDALGHQRLLALLAVDPKPGDLAAIGGSVAADYVVAANVIPAGNTYSVSLTTINSRTATVMAKSTTAIPFNADAADALERFAKQFVEDLTGPKCPGYWTGTVTVVQAGGGSGKIVPDGPTVSGSSSLKLTCQLDGTGRAAKCKATFSSTMTGKGGSFRQNGSGDVEAVITAGVINGKASVDISMFTLTVKVSGNIEGYSGESTDTVQPGPWHAEGGAARSGSLSGNWSDGAGTTITWNLSGG